jgi:hypothetical protein
VKWAGIAQSYSDSLRVRRSGNVIPVEVRFTAPVQTGSGVQPASYTRGNGSFQGVKRLGRDVDHTPHLVLGLKKSRAVLLLPLWEFMACSRENFTFNESGYFY